jgi:hypothetical protein
VLCGPMPSAVVVDDEVADGGFVSACVVAAPVEFVAGVECDDCGLCLALVAAVECGEWCELCCCFVAALFFADGFDPGDDVVVVFAGHAWSLLSCQSSGMRSEAVG